MIPTTTTPLAHDDTGGTGPLVVMLPGAGDVRSEYRFNRHAVASAGYRVVTADLPGHGESAAAGKYTVASTAGSLADLIRSLDGGPAVVVATSFAPAAAIWAAVEHPESVRAIVAISPHLHADNTLKARLTRAVIRATLRGPWAAGMWAKLYTGWYKSSPPDDLPEEIVKLRAMLGQPDARRAARETLTANRVGMEERIERLDIPTLTIFGSADDHFTEPADEARATAHRLGGDHLVVDGAGHYPHVEDAETVNGAIVSFLARVT